MLGYIIGYSIGCILGTIIGLGIVELFDNIFTSIEQRKYKSTHKRELELRRQTIAQDVISRKISLANKILDKCPEVEKVVFSNGSVVER